MANIVAITPELLALSRGEGGRLDDNGKAEVTRQICETVGLNPATIPIQWINLGGKLVPYFTKGATDQIRQSHGISIEILERKTENDMSIVRCRATKDGRQDESIGAVALKGLQGEAFANAVMKSETKAKRRVTLSIMGLGLLDESEISDPKPTHDQLAEIKRLILQLGGGKELMEWIREKYGKSDQLTPESADLLIGHLKQRLDGCSDDKGSDGEPKNGGCVMSDDFSEFDDYFAPSQPRKFLNINDLPVGDYEFNITEAKATSLQKTGEKIVDFTMQVSKGPMQGSTVNRTYFFRSDMSVNMFGADLVLLGLPAQTWTKEHGKKFSVEMPKALPTLKGKTFRGSIKESQGKDGKVYKNLRIGGIVNGAPKVEMPGNNTDEMPF